MRLKDTDIKSDRDLDECKSQYVHLFQQIIKDFNLSMDQNSKYLHNTLSEDALCFDLDAVQPYTTTYQQAVAMIERKYNLPVCQY